jgi:hypothetical protein
LTCIEKYLIKECQLNRYDLSRAIPAEIKRFVRQRDGFGCLICGSAFYQYDHIENEYKDAKEHEPEKIVLLCGGCHDKKTRGFLSTATIMAKISAPACLSKGFSWGIFDLGSSAPEIVFGTLTAKNVESLISIDGVSIFSVCPPSVPGGPFNINAIFRNPEDDDNLRIVNNEFQVLGANWDAEVSGARIKLRSGHGVFSLVLRIEPPHRLVVERLDMKYDDISITCRENEEFLIEGRGSKYHGGAFKFDDYEVAIDIRGSGVTFGVGHGRSIVRDATFEIGGDFQIGGPGKTGTTFLKQSRNEKCACGSGKRYKHCHGKLA